MTVLEQGIFPGRQGEKIAMSRNHFAFLVLGIALGTAGLSGHSVPPIQAQAVSVDEAAIREIVQGQQNAWNKGDAKAFAAYAAEDCLFTNIIGTPYVGRQAFEERHAAIFRTIYAGSQLAIRIRTLKFVTPDVAIVEAELALNGFKAIPPTIHAAADGVLYTELEEVFVKRGTGWQLVAFHNVDRKPPAPASTH
jgi:uncharacterized protein (TIGR02246 family)